MADTLRRPSRVASAFLAVSLLLGGQTAVAATYAYSSSPLQVRNGSTLVGESYGTFASRVSLGNGSTGSTASGSIRDRQPGNERIYVRLTATISARSSTTRTHTSERYNDGTWTRYPTFSAWHASSVSKVDLNVCEDIRFWVDPCSSSKRVYTR